MSKDQRPTEAERPGKCNARKKPYCQDCEERSWESTCPDCGADMPSIVKLCQKDPISGKERCYFHGGRTPRGIASTHFKHGRKSRNLPTRMISTYEAALNDDELVSHRTDLALLEARLEDLLKRVDTGEAGSNWKKLRSSWKEFIHARTNRDADGMADALDNVGEMISKGYGDYAAWAAIGQVLEQRRKIADAERKRLVEAKLVLSVDKAMALMAGIEYILKTHIKDKALLTIIAQDIIALTSGGE